MSHLAPDINLGERYTHGGSRVAAEHLAQRSAERQAAFFIPHLRRGMTLLDCGCGSGSITLGLAEIVAPGKVVGLDIDEAGLEQATLLAGQRDLANVSFRKGDIYDLPFAEHSFDAVFSSGVLHHLKHPQKALEEIRRVLRPGGVVGVRDPDFDGHLVYPQEPIIERAWEIFAQRLSANGGNPHLGKQLRALLYQINFVNVSAVARYESYGSAEAVQYVGSIFGQAFQSEESRTQILELNLATADELELIQDASDRWSKSPEAFFADCWCEVVGWKANRSIKGSTETDIGEI